MRAALGAEQHDQAQCNAVVPRWEKDKDRPPIDFVLDFFRTRPLMARNKVVVFDGDPSRAGEYTMVELQTTTGATFAGREVAEPAMAGRA